MPSKKHPKVWKADAHTIAKIKLLSEYLYRWFVILGRSCRNKDLLFVDGFCGPGEYTNHSVGSPIAALREAQRAIVDTGYAWTAGQIHCAFIDEDPERIAHLESRVARERFSRSLVHPTFHPCPFEQGVGQVRTQRPDPFEKDSPLFVFIDPFGAKGAPFRAVEPLLSSATSEVLINLDADGAARIAQAGDAADRDRILTDLFGTEAWRAELDLDRPFTEQCRRILEIYKKRLRENAEYVFSFEMRGRHGSINYYLVFASNHPQGLVKMKEAMRTIDQSHEYAFSDADVGQPSLYSFDDAAPSAEQMFAICKGCRLEWRKLEQYVLNETPFSSVSPVLQYLENNGYLAEVEPLSGTKRRQGSFSKDTVAAVRFAAEQFPTRLW